MEQNLWFSDSPAETGGHWQGTLSEATSSKWKLAMLLQVCTWKSSQGSDWSKLNVLPVVILVTGQQKEFSSFIDENVYPVRVLIRVSCYLAPNVSKAAGDGPLNPTDITPYIKDNRSHSLNRPADKKANEEPKFVCAAHIVKRVSSPNLPRLHLTFKAIS